jgi:hypothetical protein
MEAKEVALNNIRRLLAEGYILGSDTVDRAETQAWCAGATAQETAAAIQEEAWQRRYIPLDERLGNGMHVQQADDELRFFRGVVFALCVEVAFMVVTFLLAVLIKSFK